MRRLFFQKISLVASDVSSLVLTYFISIHLANLFEPERLHRFDTEHLVWVKLLNVLIIIVLFWIAELYVKRRPTWEELRIIYKQILFILVLDFLVIALSRSEQVTYLFFFMYWIILIVILPVIRRVTILLLSRLNLWQRQLYIIGTKETALNAYFLLKDRIGMGFHLQAFVSINSHEIKKELTPELGVNYPIYSLEELMCKSITSEIVVALDSETLVKNIQNIFKVQRQFLFVSIVPDFNGLPLYGMEINHFFGSEQLMLRLENNLNRRLNRTVKLLFDFFLIVLSLPILLPVMLIISLVIFLEDYGSPFFMQERLGQGGKIFKCVKFRTMHKNAEQVLLKWKEANSILYQEYVKNNFKLKDDPRITRVGKFLRKTSLDELAQVINVLGLQMSLVGPRPLLSCEKKDYGEGMFYYSMVRPGISGMWQVSGRSRTSFKERQAYDSWYIKNWSLWNDVVIILKTIAVVIRREGAY